MSLGTIGKRLVERLSVHWAHRASHPPRDEGAASASPIWRMGYAAGFRDALRDVAVLMGHLSTWEGYELPTPDRADALGWSIPVMWRPNLASIVEREPFERLPRCQTIELRRDIEVQRDGSEEWVWRVRPGTLWSGQAAIRSGEERR